jgi:class 3 adenylate cyclase
MVEAGAAAHEERKVVTVLFADLVGFTSRSEQLDPEDVRALLSPYYTRLRTELERFGGTVEKFIGDAVMALFGAPVAHEDDPERAVRAALAIRDWVLAQQADLQLRIAVNTGEGAATEEARDRLWLAERLIDQGARADADVELQRVLAFYRSVGATRYIREAEALLAASV